MNLFFMIGQNISLGRIQTAEQDPSIVVATHGLPHDVHHRCFGPVGNKIDSVDEIFALHVKHFEPVLLRFDIATKDDDAFAPFPCQLGSRFSHHAVQLPILGVDHPCAAGIASIE